MTDILQYKKEIAALETGLAPYAKRSLESFSRAFVDSQDQEKHYADHLKQPSKRSRLTKRTPLQLERDKILYSHGMRKLTEKNHVLYNGNSRIVRNFSTHTLRAQQVARALCRGLDLNPDFAEAMMLGAKTGALPFVHASKGAVSVWIQKRLQNLADRAAGQKDPGERAQLPLEMDGPLPAWVQGLNSPELIESAKTYMPWAAGHEVNHIYSSGQQAYWQLCTHPFSVESRGAGFSPETMYGIWRHTLGAPTGSQTFHHSCEISGAHPKHEIKWKHATYEAVVVQYSDDITWVIENINDAHNAALLNRAPTGVFRQAVDFLALSDTDPLYPPLSSGNSGGVYNFFINDFVETSLRHLSVVSEDALRNREAVRKGQSIDAHIGLSAPSLEYLNKLKAFLRTVVFQEPRVRNRLKMLTSISDACMDLLVEGGDELVRGFLEDRALLHRWSRSSKQRASYLLNQGDPLHRIQLAVNIFADMGDQEIFDFVGAQAL